MPQMAPLSWLTLFLLFCFTFILFNIMNYFLFQPKINSSSFDSLKSSPFNWKW